MGIGFYNRRMLSFVTALAVFVTNLAAMQAVAAPDTDPAAHAQAVIALLAAKDFAKVEAQLTDRMKTALPVDRLESGWTTLTVQVGAFRRCADARVQAIGDLKVTLSTCDFERGKVDVQISFDAAGKLAGLFFRPVQAVAPYSPPSYDVPANYSQEELTIGSDWKLPATLDIPKGPGPFAAVVLVHGSGPGDRDETVGATKPFRDLALGLASRGIAVLRYDKRTKVYAARLAAMADFTVKQETVDDALEAVKTLRAHERIDPARVFVLGHSLGAMLVPRIAAGDPRLAGLVAMAGPARPIEDAIVAQTRYLAMADGTISPDEQARIDDFAKIAAQIRALGPADANKGTLILGAPPAYWLDLQGYDAPAAAKAVKQPLLVLQGERDYQVTMNEFAKWKAALGGKPNVTLHTYPALNHLFIAGEGKSLPAEYETPGHVAEDVVRDIADWIRQQHAA
jgi:hypothetical protein